MPIYTYACPACRHEWEEPRPIADRRAPASCPRCGSSAELVLSLPSKEIIKTEGGPIAQRSKAQLERELSEQVQHNELPVNLADAQAKLGGM